MSFIPNTTPTPNWLYNGEMKKMNETQLKVVLLVTRKTLGWFDPKTQERKNQDYISQSQFMEFTGKSHTAIAHAIQSSVKAGWIIARDKIGSLCDTPDKRRRRKVWYQLGSVFTNKLSKQDSCLDDNLSNITYKSKQHNDTNLSNKVDNTKETLTKETIQKNDDKLEFKELLIKYTNFNSFYQLYPKKKDGRTALKSFKKLSPSKSLLEAILKDITKKSKSESWTKDGGKFIPYPATYINQRRWEDEETEKNSFLYKK